MINVERLNRFYGDFCAVKNVSFTIGQGEIVGLLGHNGAGKTSIMKMLTGYLEASAGKIEIDNKDIVSDSIEIQNLIGYLPESLPVYPEMTVMDYLFYCADMRNIPSAEQASAVKDAIDKTDLHEKALNPIATLSRGFKQRVGVAQALLHKPKLIILDEPTNGLDPHQTQQMRELIVSLSKTATVILSTHIMQEVEAICNRVLILDRGELAVDKSLSELQGIESIRVSSNAPISEIEKYCSGQEVKLLEENSHNTYNVRLNDKENAQSLCGSLSKAIIENGYELSEISPQFENLETIFRNIHMQRGISNAA